MVVDLIKGSGMLRLRFDSKNDKETCYHIKLRRMSEFLRLYKSATWYRDEDGGEDLYTPYTGKAKEAFDLLMRSRKDALVAKVDFHKSFESHVKGTSVLVHKPSGGTIQVAFRRNRNITNINCVCISDTVREKFFAECKQSKYYKNGRYVISKQDETLYEKWVTYMQDEYVRQYLREEI